MELLSIRKHHARTLLIHYRWDMEKLLAVLVEKGKESLFAEAGVSIVDNQGLDLPLPQTITCDICIEDVPSSEATKMDCGHCFCNECKCLCLKEFACRICIFISMPFYNETQKLISLHSMNLVFTSGSLLDDPSFPI